MLLPEISIIVDNLKTHGHARIEPEVFFPLTSNPPELRAQLDIMLDALKPAEDQPGALRYHLDDLPSILGLLAPWIYNKSFLEIAKALIGSQTLQLNYIRYREPYYGKGLQQFHYDWYPDRAEKRLEVFVPFDDLSLVNGCTEAIDRVTGEVVSLTATTGSLVILDSSILHRGTRNRSGDRRRVTSFQIRAATPDAEVSGFLLRPALSEENGLRPC